MARGLVLLLLGTVFASPGTLGAVALAMGCRFLGSIALAGGAGIWIYAIQDAYRVARRTSRQYALKEYNRWWVYLIILLLLPMPIGTGQAYLAREWLIETFYIPTIGMHPTVRLGERVAANKTAYLREPVRRGDVIIFLSPMQRNAKYMKRVVALPGDRVKIVDNRISINGEPLPMTRVGDFRVRGGKYLSGKIFLETNGSAKYQILISPRAGSAPETDQGGRTSDLTEVLVPSGHCFAMGDNRVHSLDSRAYGPIPFWDIIGRVDYVYYPRRVNLRGRAPR